MRVIVTYFFSSGIHRLLLWVSACASISGTGIDSLQRRPSLENRTAGLASYSLPANQIPPSNIL